ncbi:MAG: tyrosine--tRNA ligase [Longicatena caecimuris]|uniref:tyrosine--tRNA ligase n=1 Tax=Longicatena caecimuris TaxID=1796635 RepID=UPI00399B8672
MNIYEELVWRGLIKDCSSPKIENMLNNEKVTFYIGTDPTGDSLHIGHYSSFIISKRLKQAGHNPILLVGGGTGLIGDPKPTAERAMISKDEVAHNFACLKKQAQDVFGFEVVNNYDWIKDINTLDFLRDYGKYFNINYMLNKDIVARRLDEGITYTEFSYMILQALDFMHLYENRNCIMQVAGQDQWGNITAGIELIRKKLGKEAYGFTMPLVTKADGTKFGKSEGKAIWLDKNKTSSYELYQFLVNSEDSKVIEYLKTLTFLSREEIEDLEEKTKIDAGRREAQKALAKAVVIDLHGEEEYEKALKITNAFFKGNIKDLTSDELEDALHGFDSIAVDDHMPLLDVLVQAKIASSKREAREWIKQGSIQINGERIKDCEFIVSSTHAITTNKTIIKRGKRNYYVITQ